jgi:D-erythro-7,8-dihydroneopterin triphosphate epimerase
MTDRIFLDNIRLRCRIGITPEERSEPQEVIVGVSMVVSLARAGKSDDLKDTVNYREVMERISTFVSGGEFNLLESLAEGIASLTLEAFRVERVTVNVRKAKYSSEPLIAIEIERGGGPWSSRS